MQKRHLAKFLNSVHFVSMFSFLRLEIKKRIHEFKAECVKEKSEHCRILLIIILLSYIDTNIVTSLVYYSVHLIINKFCFNCHLNVPTNKNNIPTYLTANYVLISFTTMQPPKLIQCRLNKNNNPDIYCKGITAAQYLQF